ncbi:response regulator [[Phormidium] sp. ETS-05]|uniref:response regulator n=1 Tax=[Phormidium] sp. ETS-05 TaxID=222819 RepID=UPI0018EEF635|nr:response regulator [[Phormidium] sp. ETS-05]
MAVDRNILSEKTILVVDDNATNLHLLAVILSRKGYQVRVANNGHEALNAVHASFPDLILLDVMMPDLDGYQVCHILKTQKTTREIPVIFISARQEAIDKVKAFDLGALDYITKPFHVDEVLARVDAQIRITHLQKQLAAHNLQLQQEMRDRLAAEKALRESESKYRALVEASQDVIWLADLEGRYRFVNGAVEKIYGYAPEEIIGQKLTDLMTPEQAARDAEILGMLLQGESIIPYETQQLHRDGRMIDVRINAVALRDGEGNIVGMTGTACDITESKLVEKEIRLLLATNQTINLLGSHQFENVSSRFPGYFGNGQNAKNNDGHLLSPLSGILSLICTEMHWDVGEAWLLSSDSKVWQCRSGWYGGNGAFNKLRRYSERVSLAPGVGLPGRLVFSKNSEWIEDISQENQAVSLHEKIAAEVGLKTCLAVPVMAGEKVVAVLVLYKGVKSSKNQRTIDLVEAVAASVRALVREQQAEEALKLSQERLKLALEGSSLGIWDRDIPSGKTYFDPQWKKMLGYEAGEIENSFKSWLRLVHPDDLTEVMKVFNGYLPLGTDTCEVEFRMLTKQGQWKWMLSRGKVFERDSLGKPVRMTGTQEDISDRVSAEQELRESADRERAIATVIQRMRQSLDLETIFDATTSELRGVLGCDRVAVYQFHSDWSGSVVAESVGNAWVPLVTKPSHDQTLADSAVEYESCPLKNLGRTSFPVVDTYLQQTQGSFHTRGFSYLCLPDIDQAELDPCYRALLERFQAKAYIIVPIFCGQKLWGLLASYQNSGPRQWRQAEINIAVQIGTQLGTAVQQAELLAQTQRQSAALQQAALAADAANRAKSEFLASMSHELRTPLNAILGFTQIMTRDASLTREQRENLGIVNRAGEHLLALIDDILEMSKIEAGRTTLNPISFDLSQLLDTLERMLQLKARAKGLQLIFDIAPGLPQYVHTDEGKLRQVLINILGNAIKFTQQGGVTLRVRTAPVKEASMSDTRLCFEIEDTGLGIKQEELDLLFQPFAQAETGRNSGQGTGLGLPISRKFVQLMGGDIQVRSTPGQGSWFGFDIQLDVAETADMPAADATGQVIALAPNQPPYRILVVDDVRESRLLLVTLLSGIGFQVREAENGLQAVAIWESWQPHLIVMDIQMPVMDGLEAIKEIKSRRQGAETVIIALTASVFEEERKMVLATGGDDFVRKPFRQGVLLEKISQHLGVVYLYEEDQTAPKPAAANNSENLLDDELKTYLAQMPPDWLERVHAAARDGSDDGILEVLEEIPDIHHRLEKTLADLANNFQFQKIMELTRQYST